MTSSTTIAKVEQKRIIELIANGKRMDERGLTDYRDAQIEIGVIERAEGSARVHLGQTEILVGIKIGIGEPFPDIPNEGVLTVNAELVPIASPKFEPGPPNENAIELARVVDRGVRESKAIDVEKLCIIPGKKVFIVFIDVYVLNHDGNLIDASAIAALAALLNTKIFNYEIKEGEVEIKPGYTQLPIVDHPIAITFAKINNNLIVDPRLVEEEIMDARLTMTIDKDGRICSIQKGGHGCFSIEQLKETARIAQKKAEELRKIVVKD